MKRINQLDKLNREILKDNLKIRIAILCALAACTIGVFVWSVIKTDVIGFILDVILLGGFVFYLTCNIIVMPIENRRYKYRVLSEDDIREINDYINLLEGEKSNVAKREYLLEILQKNEEYLERERIRKEKTEKGEAVGFTLEELERFARENPTLEELKKEIGNATLEKVEENNLLNQESEKAAADSERQNIPTEDNGQKEEDINGFSL